VEEGKHPVDMDRIQRPYERGPQARKNVEDEFARAVPGVRVDDLAGAARLDEMERRLLEKRGGRKETAT
jgi:hypothetical protein